MPVALFRHKDSAPRVGERHPGDQMHSATPTLEVLASRLDGYTRFIQQHFFRTLNHEDCANAVQDAFVDALAGDVCGRLEPPQVDAWLKTAAYKKALNIMRKRNGRGRERRSYTDIDTLAEVLADTTTMLMDDDTGDDDAQAVMAAFRRLPAREQRIIRLRHLDHLPRETCAKTLGLPVAKYKRAHTAAVKRLVSLVVETRPHDTCLEARSLIDLSTDDLLDDQSAARRDAHLAGCANCRQYRRRSRGLLIFLPLPAIGMSDRALARLHGVLERLMPAAPSADAAATAGGAGLLGASTTKLAVLAATGTAAVGGGGAVYHHATTDSQHKTTPATSAQTKPATTTISVPTTVSAQRSRQQTTATDPPASLPHTRQTRSSPSSSAELKPRGHDVAVPNAPTVATSVLARAAASSSHQTSRAAPLAAPVAKTADSSSGEFAPHP